MAAGNRDSIRLPHSQQDRYVGRVGALAIALGIGAAVVVMPVVASAETTGSTGSAGSAGSADGATTKTRPSQPGAARSGSRSGDGDSASTPARSAQRGAAAADTTRDIVSTPRRSGRVNTRLDVAKNGPVRDPRSPFETDRLPAVFETPVSEPVNLDDPALTPAAAAQPAPTAARDGSGDDPAPGIAATATASAPSMSATPIAARGAVSGLGRTLGDWLRSGAGDAPAAAPLMWTAAAFTRRDFSTRPATLKAAATSTGEPATPASLSASVVQAPKVSATGGLTANQFRLFGDGTADNPDAGLLWGNGYTYISYEGACTSGPCDGGRAGLLFGNGGDGFNGGQGGWAGLLIGNDGAGGLWAPPPSYGVGSPAALLHAGTIGRQINATISELLGAATRWAYTLSDGQFQDFAADAVLLVRSLWAGQQDAPTITGLSVPDSSAPKGSINGGNVLQIAGGGFVDASGKKLLVVNVSFYPSAMQNAGGTGDIKLVGTSNTPHLATIEITVPDLTKTWGTGLPMTGTAPVAVVVTVPGQPTSNTTMDSSNKYTVGYGPTVTSVKVTDTTFPTGKPVANGPLAGNWTLTIEGTDFDSKSTVMFRDPVSNDGHTVASANVKYVDDKHLTVTVPDLRTTFTSDVTVDVLVTGSNGFSSSAIPNDKVTFYTNDYTTLAITVPQALAEQGIYLASFARQLPVGTDPTKAVKGITMKVVPGMNGTNVGTFVNGEDWAKQDPKDSNGKVMKDNPELSFGAPDKDGNVTATIQYDNYLYSNGIATSGAAAVLSVGAFPRIVLSNDVNFTAGLPDPSANPGLTYGVLELAVSAIEASNYTAANSFLDITYVDQFGMPIQFSSTPSGAFPKDLLGVGDVTSQQDVIASYGEFVKNSHAAAFGELLTAGETVQILAPSKYLAQVEGAAGIQPTLDVIRDPSFTLTAPTTNPPGVDPSKITAKGYFYYVTAVGSDGGEFAARAAKDMGGVQVDGEHAGVLLNWDSFPSAAIPTATGYHIYRQPGWVAAGEPWQPYGDVVKLTSAPVQGLSYIDTGAEKNPPKATLPDTNTAYSALSSYFDEALDTFFTHYTNNSFTIYRDKLTLTGNTVDGGETTGVPFQYKISEATSTQAAVYGKERVYGRALLLTDVTDPENQFVFLDPSSPHLKQNTWMGVQANLGYSAGYQIFGAAGAAGDGGPADAMAQGGGNVWKDLQNSIATAFDRGLATNFAVAPTAWATPPQFSAPAVVSPKPGTLQKVPYTYAVTGLIHTGSAGGTPVETTISVLTTVTPDRDKAAVTLQWSTAPTGAPPDGYQSFNVYRAQGEPGQSLTYVKVNDQPIPLTVGQTTVQFDDTGNSIPIPTQPASYFASGTSSDIYAAFMHSIAANGRSYGYAYDDQGDLASTSSIDYLQAAQLTVLPWAVQSTTPTKERLAVDPLPKDIRADALAKLSIGLQTMAQEGYPTLGVDGRSVKVTFSDVPGIVVGTKVAVSYTNGRAVVDLSGTQIPTGTYSLTLQLVDVHGPVSGVDPVTVPFTIW